MRFIQMGSSWSEQSRKSDRARRRKERQRKQRQRRAWMEHPAKQAWKTWGPFG